LINANAGVTFNDAPVSSLAETPRSCPMSELGQKRKCPGSRGTSVSPSGADIVGLPRHVRLVPEAIIPEPLRSSRSFQDAQRSAGEPGIHPSAGRPPSRAARHKTAPPFVRDGRARPPEATAERTPKLHRLGPADSRTTIGESDCPTGVCPSTRRREPLSRASPSGTRSRSGGAPLPRPAPWRAA
jgi:hypothetical protein